MARIAFMTIGLLHETYGHPRVRGFFDRASLNFLAAEASHGFIAHPHFPNPDDEHLWGAVTVPKNLQNEASANRVVMPLTLWRDLESVFAFAYNGVHTESLSQRKEWFVPLKWPTYVTWWVGDDHIPRWDEACARYEDLEQKGSLPHAFDFKHPFSPDGQPITLDRDATKRIAAIGKLMTIEATLKTYIVAWSEPDNGARQGMLEAVWSEDGRYTDPLSHADSRAELDTVIAQFLGANPSAKFTLKEKIDSHHVHVRFYWTLRLTSGPELTGMDYGEIAPDGKLARIVGFF